MGCFGKSCGQFFEHGFGKIWLIIAVLLVASYIVSFTKCTFFPKAYPSDAVIDFKENIDFFLGKNVAGYKGYIRFKTDISRSAELSLQEKLTVVMALEAHKNTQFTYGVRVELLNEDYDIISDIVFPVSSFAAVISGYSYNVLIVQFYAPHDLANVKYFRYSLTP